MMTQDKETLREAVARIAEQICGCATPDQRKRDIALIEAEIDRRVAEEKAKLFERLRTPSDDMIQAGDTAPKPSEFVWQAMLAAFQQENSECRE